MKPAPPGIEKRNKFLPDRIGGRVNPTADSNFITEIRKECTVVGGDKVRLFFCGWVVSVYAKIRPNLPFSKEAVVPLQPETVKCRPLPEESVRRVSLSGVDSLKRQSADVFSVTGNSPVKSVREVNMDFTAMSSPPTALRLYLQFCKGRTDCRNGYAVRSFAKNWKIRS